jgi:hypothetical protein
MQSMGDRARGECAMLSLPWRGSGHRLGGAFKRVAHGPALWSRPQSQSTSWNRRGMNMCSSPPRTLSPTHRWPTPATVAHHGLRDCVVHPPSVISGLHGTASLQYFSIKRREPKQQQ